MALTGLGVGVLFGGLALGVGYLMWKRRAPPTGKGRLKVTVKDSDTGSPIGGALVAVDAVDGTTGVDGVVTFDLDPGEWFVRVSKSGYLGEEMMATVQEGQETHIEVFLSPSGLGLRRGSFFGV